MDDGREDEAEYGPLEAATRAAVEELGDLDGIQGPLSELAFVLAKRMDDGARGMAAAAIARELRETLRAMTEAADDSDAVTELLAQLASPVVSPEVRNPASP
jgi:hypothetical protein